MHTLISLTSSLMNRYGTMFHSNSQPYAMNINNDQYKAGDTTLLIAVPHHIKERDRQVLRA